MGSTNSSARPTGGHVTVQSTAKSPATRFVSGEVRMFRIHETVHLEVRGRRIKPLTPTALSKIQPGKAQIVHSSPAVNHGQQQIQRPTHPERKKRLVSKRIYANFTGNGTAANRRSRGAACSAHSAGNRTKKNYSKAGCTISHINLEERDDVCDNDDHNGGDVRGRKIMLLYGIENMATAID